jgi:hypothetical protein
MAAQPRVGMPRRVFFRVVVREQLPKGVNCFLMFSLFFLWFSHIWTTWGDPCTLAPATPPPLPAQRTCMHKRACGDAAATKSFSPTQTCKRKSAQLSLPVEA